MCLWIVHFFWLSILMYLHLYIVYFKYNSLQLSVHVLQCCLMLPHSCLSMCLILSVSVGSSFLLVVFMGCSCACFHSPQFSDFQRCSTEISNNRLPSCFTAFIVIGGKGQERFISTPAVSYGERGVQVPLPWAHLGGVMAVRESWTEDYRRKTVEGRLKD